jgi:hypothetical protein
LRGGAGPTPASKTTSERRLIAARAYQLYEAGADGDSVAHWLAAERELVAA